MNIWNSESLQAALAIVIANKHIQTSHIEFNSQNISGGELFIALTGGVTDGHSYVADALARGAACAVVSKVIDDVDITKLIIVTDTYAALLALAKYKRQHSTAKFFGITGSVGKTSTKNFLAAALKAHGNVFASRGNFNNHLGVPINLASMPDNIAYAVLEMGMNHAGELSELTALVKPDVALITNIEAAHIGHLGSLEAIANAKSEIFSGLNAQGIAVINISSNCADRIMQNLKHLKITNIFKFGDAGSGADAEILSIKYSDNLMHVQYEVLERYINITTTILGKHQAMNLAAIGLILSLLKLDNLAAINNLATILTENGRGLIFKLILEPNKQIRLINDSYNASPASVIAALNNLKNQPTKRKVVVLANMNELGEFTQTLHESLVQHIIDNKIDQVITMGEYAKFVHNKLPTTIAATYFNDLDSLSLGLIALLQNEDTVLFKGSRATKLYLLVDQLINKYQNDL